MRSVDNETAPTARSPKFLVVLPIDLEIPRLAVAVLEHRALDLDRRSVPKLCIVPVRAFQVEPSLLRHPLLTDRPEVVRSLTPVHESRSFLGGWSPSRSGR